MVRINWTLQSKSDLKHIADYISLHSKRYAKLQVLRIKNRTQILKTHPFAGKIVREIENDNIRELIEGRYRIIYKVISKSRIDILTIHHSARDITKRKL
jgi:addiction module RelE/StbE family toxin